MAVALAGDTVKRNLLFTLSSRKLDAQTT